MSRARRLLPIAVVVVAIVVMGYALRGAGPAIRTLWDRPGAGWMLGGAVLVAGAGTTLLLGVWRAVLAGLGSPIAFRTSVRIYFGAMIGARVAGAVGSAGASVQLGRMAGIPVPSILSGYLVNAVVVVLSGAVVGLLATPGLLGARPVLLVVPVVAGAVVVAWPRLIIAAVHRAVKVLRRGPTTVDASPPALRRAFLTAGFAWLVGSLHLWFIVLVLGAPPAESLPISVGSFALATVAGTVAVFVPDGAGVREVVAMGALATLIPLPYAGLAVLVSRTCCVAGDLLAAGCMLLLARLGRGQA